jgi:ubiquitin-small subunit ribosomal protein S27Ae
VLRLRGGAKKRKKKVYTKPKKIKHKRKKVVLAVLRYYQVSGVRAPVVFLRMELTCMVMGQVDDNSGKVKRLRKDCPTCGAGVRMAVHVDRYHCGQCKLTVSDSLCGAVLEWCSHRMGGWCCSTSTTRGRRHKRGC